MQLNIPLAKRPFALLGQWLEAIPVEYIIGFTMATMGVSIVAFPTVAVIASLSSLFGIDGRILGAVITFCAMAVMTKPSTQMFLALTFPFLFYVVLAVIYIVQVPGTSPVFVTIYVGHYLLMLKVYQWKAMKDAGVITRRN